MKKTMKKVVIGALAAAMLAGSAAPVAVSANSGIEVQKKDKKDKKNKKKESQKIAKVTCTASGKINISFKSKVAYTDAMAVTIQDEAGNAIECSVGKCKKTGMTVNAKGLVKGQKYVITIEGVKGKNTDEAVTITKTFVAKGMKTGCKVDKVVIAKDTLIVKFKGNAEYKDAVVTLTDEAGNVVETSIVKKAKGNMKIKAVGLVKGAKYTLVITGIKTKKEKNYSSITKTFVVK